MTTTIKSQFGKTLRLRKYGEGQIALKPLSWGYANPNPQSDALFQSEDILNALKAEGLLNGTLITDLPEAKLSTCGRYVMVGDIDRSLHASAPDILAHAKQLLAIAAFLTKHNAEKEEAKKAEAEAEAAKAKEAARAKRRDEVTQELTGDPYARYSDRFAIVKKAIDRIVDLEEAAKVS